jgi:hypothetical protein
MSDYIYAYRAVVPHDPEQLDWGVNVAHPLIARLIGAPFVRSVCIGKNALGNDFWEAYYRTAIHPTRRQRRFSRRNRKRPIPLWRRGRLTRLGELCVVRRGEEAAKLLPWVNLVGSAPCGGLALNGEAVWPSRWFRPEDLGPQGLVEPWDIILLVEVG